jgi:hypothetical protein
MSRAPALGTHVRLPMTRFRCTLRSVVLAPRRALPALLALLSWSACAQQEHAILIEARTQGAVDLLQVTVIDRAGARAPARSMRSVRRTAAEINEEAPIRIAVPLPGPSDVLVHLIALGPGDRDRYVATRCYSTRGEAVIRDTVLLVGPIGADLDGDGDGFPADSGAACRDPGETAAATVPCDFACDGSEGADCDDADAARFPGARDLCQDGIDQDCNGVDPDCADNDDDGWDACSATDPVGTCDCEDSDATVRPDADEICRDGIDQDCDGTDQSCDDDGDGFPADRDVGGAPDCDDTDPSIHPDAEEVCTPEDDPTAEPRDENCNGFVDEAAGCTSDDLDRDGFCACGLPGCAEPCDENDCDQGIRPGAPERCGNGIDEDQSGADAPCPAVDADLDGFAPSSAGGADCDDSRADTFPGAPERCGDGLAQSCIADEPCEGRDTDGDGFVPPADCGEGNRDQAPGVTETCNLLDDDCDGLRDEVLSSPTMIGPVTFSDGTTGCVPIDSRMVACVGQPACSIDFTSAFFHCGGCRVECDTETADVCASGTCDCVGDLSTVAACATGTSCCPDGCHDLASDFENCGACERSCSAIGDRCAAGACACGGGPACDPLGALGDCCGEQCVDITSNPLHCGACGNACRANQSCGGSRCVCNPGYDDCDGDPSNGCETDLRTTALHCGACGNACSRAGASSICVDSACRIGACYPLVDDCDRADPNGCETSLETTSDCGSCATPCARPNATAVCGGGTCRIGSCASGFGDCDGSDGNGCEDPLDSLTHCGGCGIGCSRDYASATCAGDTCRIAACIAGAGNCDGNDANGCEDPLESVTNCGACGTPCTRPNATATCAGELCRIAACNGGFGNCDGNDGNGCEDPLDSLSSCGGCGVGCSRPNAIATCGGDVCAIASCAAGFGNCDGDGGNGCENTLDSVTHCGGCGVGCSRPNASASCGGDVCTLGTCNAGWGNCDGNATNGCENSLDSVTHCGGCGTPCMRPNATTTCAGDVCAISGCAAGFDDCDGSSANGCEATVVDDELNCGGCGIECNAGETCMAGRCQCGVTRGSVGGGAACTGLTDRCTAGNCTCGGSGTCDATRADRCTSGNCRCGTSPSCTGPDRCMSAMCM